MIYAAAVFLLIASSATAKIYFKEDFNDKSWEKRWTVPSDWKPKVLIFCNRFFDFRFTVCYDYLE